MISSWSRCSRIALAVGLPVACGGEPAPTLGPVPEFEEVVERLGAFIEHEMQDKGLPGLSIAMVDGDRIVWARGFGFQDPETETPATAHTIYRVGSVSKLFTDMGIMQLVEEERVDLDASVRSFLPQFIPNDPRAEAITLRHLAAHRSGLVREPPVGHYFDVTAPSLAATVQSLNATELVFAPESVTKYSNAGIAVVGHVLEQVRGEPFIPVLERTVLQPLGMRESSFAPRRDLMDRLARAYMWTLDGRVFEAPGFQLGMVPAGSMYAPVTDLGRFLIALFNDGVSARGRVLGRRSLDEMLRPQFAETGVTTGYGIGFRLGEMYGHRRIGHGGAIYGFATDLAALPDLQLGVVSATTMDGANTVVQRINEFALRLMVAQREGTALPQPTVTTPVPDSLADRMPGRYQHVAEMATVVRRGEEMYLSARGRRHRIRWLDGTMVADGRLGFGLPIDRTPAGDLVIADAVYRRLPNREPPPPPARWEGLIGEYGWDHNTLYVFEDGGRLYALIEWFFIDALTELGDDLFAFPAGSGLYPGEHLRFVRNGEGRAISVEAAGIVFERREVGTTGGETFTIDPVRPVAELRALAAAATPPAQPEGLAAPDLVEIRHLDPSIRYDIRYATTNNFMQDVFYEAPHAFMQRSAAEALVRAHRALRPFGYGLLIHDAYRPWSVTRMFWDATPADQKQFVADPANGSRHNRGAAVDLTLYDLRSGQVAETVSGYDEFSDRAYPDYPGGTSQQRWRRELLRGVMEAEGFTVYEWEWWHFDFRDWARYPILNVAFDDLGP